MSTGDQQSTGPSGSDALDAFVQRLRPFAQQYGRGALIALAAVLVVYFAWHGYRGKARAQRAASWEALSGLPATDQPYMKRDEAEEMFLQAIDGCQEILDEHWKTDATPWVLLKMASAQGFAGLHEDALATHLRLQEEYPSHLAARISAPNLAGTMEQLGRYRDAATEYERIARQQGEHSSLWADAARCWEMAGEKEAALRAYEKVAQEEGFAAAAFRLKSLTAGKPLLTAPPPPPSRETLPRGEDSPPGAEPSPERPVEGEGEKSPVSD